MSTSNKGAGVDYRLQNVANALFLNTDDDVTMRTHVEGITLQTGDILVDKMKIWDGTNNLLLDQPNNDGEAGQWSLPTETYNMVFNGSTWDRLRGDTTSGAWVNIKNSTIAITDNNGSITVDGSVNIGSMPEVEIKNDTGNPISISKNNTINSDSNPIFVKGTSDTSFFSPTQTDAFGRLRVSNPFPLFDSFHRYQDNGKLNQYTSGTASSNYNTNAGVVNMTVGSDVGDKIYRESSLVFAYQPGKSLLILQTFCMNIGKPGLRQRQGYFDLESGFYIELDGTTLNFVRRTSVSGTLQEWRVPQSEWSVDTLLVDNIRNPSGFVLDISKVQIFWIDIEWLGVGSARMGFVINGEFIHCHTFHHANQPTSLPYADTTLPYMITACLPVRAELENMTSTGSASNYRLICSTVISEGGYELNGRPRNVGHDLSSPRLISSGSIYPIFTMRLKTNRLGAIAIPKTFSIAVTGNTNFKWSIVESGTTFNGSWISAGSDSSIEYNLSATTISGGTVVETGYIINSNQATSSPNLASTPFKYQLKRNTFTSTAYEFTICIETQGSNVNAWASVNWEEVT